MKECSNCGMMINPARLRIRPDATLCILCQSVKEKQPGGFARHKMSFTVRTHGDDIEMDGRIVRAAL